MVDRLPTPPEGRDRARRRGGAAAAQGRLMHRIGFRPTFELRRRSRRALRSDLLDLLVRVDAPQALLLDPAVEALAGDAAPAVRCSASRCRGRRLQLRDDAPRPRPAWRAARTARPCPRRRDQRGAPAGQQRVVDPALRAFAVADAPPVLEFGGDLDRQAGAGVDPGDVVILGRAGAHIHLVGLQADEARQRQPARPVPASLAACAGAPQARQASQHDRDRKRARSSQSRSADRRASAAGEIGRLRRGARRLLCLGPAIC